MVPRGAGSFFHHAGHHEPFEGVVTSPYANGHVRFYIRPHNVSHHNDVLAVKDHSDNRRSEDGHYRSIRISHMRVVSPDTLNAGDLKHALFEAHPID